MSYNSCNKIRKRILKGPSQQQIRDANLSQTLLTFTVNDAKRRTPHELIVSIHGFSELPLVHKSGVLWTRYQILGLTSEGEDYLGEYIPNPVMAQKLGYLAVEKRPSRDPRYR